MLRLQPRVHLCHLLFSASIRPYKSTPLQFSFSQTLSAQKMSTFTLPEPNPPAQVTIQPHISDLSESEILNFPAFKTWLSTLRHSFNLQAQPSHPFHADPYTLRSIDIQAVDRFGGDRLGFLKMRTLVSNSAGEKLPGAIFLRGGAVAMLVILQPDDVPADSEAEKHVILTTQPRIPAGTLDMHELPAGMLDDAGTFAGAAAKEIEEEVGLTIPADELIDITRMALDIKSQKEGRDTEKQEILQKAIYTSGGGSDEFIAIFMHQRRVKRETLKEWTGKLTGLREHGEKITLRLVKLEDLWWEAGNDCKAVSAFGLYEGLRKAGRI